MWTPKGGAAGAEFKCLLSLIPEKNEREAVTKFVFFEDQKRALLSRLLCRRACCDVLGLPSFKALEIRRTRGQKPFLLQPRPQQEDLANWNFNVSHEGDWVVLASEPLCICGVDVAAPARTDPSKASIDVKRDFGDYLTSKEWEAVEKAAAGDVAAAVEGPPGYAAFQRYWSSKEALVKARGDGLGFDLHRASFDFDEPRSDDCQLSGLAIASVLVDGTLARHWRFFQHQLDDGHCVTVARGPTFDVVDQKGEFAKTLTRPTAQFSAAAWDEELARVSPNFEVLAVGQLIPEDAIEAFLRVGGEIPCE